MKTVYLWILALGFIAASCSSSYRTTRVYDDVYTAHDYPVVTQTPSYSTTPPPASGTTEPMRNRYEDTETYVDGEGNTYITKNYYGDNYSFYEDEYDYHYSSRINRFHRPYMGFSYWGGGYTDYYWYNPMYMGTSIYVGWGRPWWNRPYMWGGYYGPMYGMGWHNPWGWNSWGGYYGMYQPWGWGGYGMGYNMGYMHGYNQGYMHGYYGNTGYWGSAMHGGGSGVDYGVSPTNYYYGSRNAAAGGNVDNLASRRSSVDGPGKTNEIGTGRTGRYVAEVPRTEQSGSRLNPETVRTNPVSRGEAIRRDPVQSGAVDRITRTPESLDGTSIDRGATQRNTQTPVQGRNVGTINDRRDVVERQQQTDMINRESRTAPQRTVGRPSSTPQRQFDAPQQQRQVAPQRTPAPERDYRAPQTIPQQRDNRAPDYSQPGRNIEPRHSTPTRTIEPQRDGSSSPGRSIDRGSSAPGRNYSPQPNRSIQRSTPSKSSTRQAAPSRSSSPSRSVGTPSGGSRSVGTPSGGGSRSVGSQSSSSRPTGGGRGPR